MLAGRGQHSAGIYADMSLDGPEIGTLVVVVDRAKNLPNLKTVGKQDPYCAVRLGKEAKKTTTDRRGGQTPRWDQELRFIVRDSLDYHKIKVSIFNDDKKTDLIGEAFIKIDQVLKPGGGQSDAWHDLNSKGRFAGQVRIEFSFYDSRPRLEETQAEPAFETHRSLTISATQRQYGPRELPTPKRKPLPNRSAPLPLREVAHDHAMADCNIPLPRAVPRMDHTQQHEPFSYRDQEHDDYYYSAYDDGENAFQKLPVASSFAGSDSYSQDSGYESTEQYDQGKWMQQQYMDQYQTEWDHLQDTKNNTVLDKEAHAIQDPFFVDSGGSYQIEQSPQEQHVAEHFYNTQSGYEQRPMMTHSNSAPVFQRDEHQLRHSLSNQRRGQVGEAEPWNNPQAIVEPRYPPQHMQFQPRQPAAPLPPMHRHSAPTTPRAEAPMSDRHGQFQRSGLSRMTHVQDMPLLPPSASRDSRRGLPAFPPHSNFPTYHSRNMQDQGTDMHNYNMGGLPPQRGPAPHMQHTGVNPRRTSGDVQAIRIPVRSKSFAEAEEHAHEPYQQEPLYSSSYNALPIIRPRPRSAPRADDAAQVNIANPYGASANFQQTPILAARPAPRRSAGGFADVMPLSPSSFDALNEHTADALSSASISTSITAQRESVPMYATRSKQGHGDGAASKLPPIPNPQQPILDPNSPIRTSDGRLVDPSDHLPPTSYAPEPEAKPANAKRAAITVNVKSRFGPRDARGPSQGTPFPPAASALNPVSTRAQKRQNMPVKPTTIIPLQPSPSAALNIGAPHHFDPTASALSREFAKIDIGRVGEKNQLNDGRPGNGRLRKVRTGF